MNKSLICEIAIAHNYGSKKRFQEARNKIKFTAFFKLGFKLFSVSANREKKRSYIKK